MSKYADDTDMSELEREFELDMEDEPTDEKELEKEFEYLAEFEEEPSEEFEDIEEESDDYAERFYELSTRSFESESEVDDAVNGLLNEMERDFFFKGLGKKLKKLGKGLLKKGLKFGLKFIKGSPIFQAVKGITQLARGNLKGLLGSLAKAGLGTVVSAIPGGAAIAPALKSLGFEATEDPEENREAWDNYVAVAREAFDHLARNLNENADDPIEASQLANEAYQTAIKSASSTKPYSRPYKGNYRVVRVRRGERILIKVE